MPVLNNVVLILQILSAFVMIGLVLIQHGKGADMGAAFGSGSSGSLFGASGSANFLSRTTAVLAALFFILSLALAYVATRRPLEEGGVMDTVRRSAPQKPAAAPQTPADSTQKPSAEAPKPPAEGAKDKQVPQ